MFVCVSVSPTHQKAAFWNPLRKPFSRPRSDWLQIIEADELESELMVRTLTQNALGRT